MTPAKSRLAAVSLALTFASPSHADTFALFVADPSEWALFLSGLGLIGLMLGRGGW